MTTKKNTSNNKSGTTTPWYRWDGSLFFINN